MAKVTHSRTATAVDIHVGQKIRARRIFLQMSQTEVADGLGITFQQIQKYEKGTNRVGASRLQQISDVLGVSPFYFFEGAPTVGKKILHRRKASYRSTQSCHSSELVTAPLLYAAFSRSNKSQFVGHLLILSIP